MSDESLEQQAKKLAFESLMWQLVRPPEIVRPQGEKIDIPVVDEVCCWSCNNPGGEMLHFGGIHIHNKPDCRHTAGIPDDEPKHDGNLGDHTVDYWDNSVEVEKIDNDLDWRVRVLLSPKEALSLLVWLKQEEVNLQSLAYKQDALRDANTKAGE